MSSAKAITKYIRISPRKARLAADLIRGLSLEKALMQLAHCNLKAGPLLQKTVNSAASNAETQFEVRRENLMIAEVRVDAGPVFKRAKSKNKGGRHPIMKRTSHFVVVVKEA